MADEGQLSQEEIDALMEGKSPFDFGDTETEEPEKKKEETDYASIIGGEKKEKKAKKKPPRESLGDFTLDSDNMELLLDVNMTLTVELGRTRRSVKEVLSYGEGSIVELEKLSGEPVDILVNGRLIARGEVVVIDETYGVRVTELLDPYESLKSLQA
jgi:flagellar motor switch protein FliN/FliY